MYFFKKILHPFEVIEQKIKASADCQRFEFEKFELERLILNSGKAGVQESLISEKPVIVTLTTHGQRIYDVHLAIESIMQGTVLPNRIILWISDKYENLKIPAFLQKQQQRGLEIKFCRDIRSYTKLIPALQTYPDSILVTIDDDIIYPADTLENLINAHNEFPDCVCANFIRRYPDISKGGKISILNAWPSYNNKPFTPFYGFFEGFGGVLYPVNSLHAEVFNEDFFLNVCKTADDIWFNAMSLMNDTKVVYSNTHLTPFDYLENCNVQSIGLFNKNAKGLNLNMGQLNTVYERYGLWGKLA